MEPGELELRLWPELGDEATRSRRREAQLASVVLHVAAAFLLGVWGQLFPAPKSSAPARPQQHVTLLFPAPKVLTQKEPNRAPPSKLFLGAQELARLPKLRVENAPPSPPPSPSAGPKGETPEPPQLAPRPEHSAPTQVAQILPPPSVAEPPKLVLEDVHRPAAGRPGSQPTGALAPKPAGGVIEGAVRELSRNPGAGGTVVGDGYGGGVPGGFTSPAPGSIGSNLELLSDPLGVDFKPYLIRILAAVRRNWYAVIPESARLGMVRGRVGIQFIIIKAGGVSKLVIATPSGMEALDRAAVAGISASNPFPPLPGEFRGDQVRLQFNFLYNIPVQ